VAQAESCISKEGQGYFSGSHHLAIAIECLRQSNGDETRIQILPKRLVEWQAKAMSGTKSASHEIDLSAIVKNAEERVRGKKLPDEFSRWHLDVGCSSRTH
jgi:hypothetical protein